MLFGRAISVHAPRVVWGIMSSNSNFDASTSALGYLYQCRFALLLALQRADDPAQRVSIEKLDDIGFSTANGKGEEDPVKLLQLKHHIKRSGGTSDKALDVWKSLRVWIAHIRNSKVQLENTTFVLVTTSTVSSTHALWMLKDDKETRNSEKARAALETAGATSNNETVKKCYASLMKLSVKRRKDLFDRIIVADAALDTMSLVPALKKELWKAVDKQHITAFLERLEGWWFSLVIEHLADESNSSIPLNHLNSQIHLLRERFKRDNLPPDFLDGDVPQDEIDEKDTRRFVRQLVQIGIGRGRIRKAQENHYRAVAQRSRWIRNQLLEIVELDEFEMRLIREWEEKFEIMNERVECSTGQDAVSAYQDLYEWTQERAVICPSLFIRPQFQAPYLTRAHTTCYPINYG